MTPDQIRAEATRHPLLRLQRGEEIIVEPLTDKLFPHMTIFVCEKTKFAVAFGKTRNGNTTVLMKEHPDYPELATKQVEVFYDPSEMVWRMRLTNPNLQDKRTPQ